MSLLDELGGLLGQGNNGQLIQAVIKWIDAQGGLQALIAKLEQGGLGSIASSWVANGQNQPVTGEQITGALGEGEIGNLASSIGVEPAQVSSLLAQVLPGIVDNLSPNGEAPQGGSLLESGIELLCGKLLG